MAQSNFNEKYKAYEKRYDSIKQKAETLQGKREQMRTQAVIIRAFMGELEKIEQPITEFDRKIWLAFIDSVLVKKDGRLVFKFKNGTEIEE